MTSLLLVLLTAAPTVPVKAEFHYTLAHGAAVKCIGRGCDKPGVTAMKQTWFFVVPASRADQASMNELVHRIFYDSNVVMREHEPSDTGFMKLLDVKSEKFDEKSMLTAKSADEIPWNVPTVWEPSCCYLVDEAGNWDTLKWGELSELFAMRLMDRKALDEPTFLTFWKGIANNDSGQMILNDKANRQKSLTAVRVDASRRKPGSKPIVSSPDEAKSPK